MPKVFKGIHFVWVPEYPEAPLRSHWISINGVLRTHVLEPTAAAPGVWTVFTFEFASDPDAADFITKIDILGELAAFGFATQRAREGER